MESSAQNLKVVLDLSFLREYLPEPQKSSPEIISKELSTLSEIDITNPELGEKYGFSDGQDTLEKFNHYCSSVLKRVYPYVADLPDHLLSQSITALQQAVQNMSAGVTQIEQLAAKGATQQNYESQRNQKLTHLVNLYSQLEQKLYPITQALEYLELKERFDRLDLDQFNEQLRHELVKFQKDSEVALDKTKQASNQAQKLLNATADKANKQQIEVEAERYETLRKHHQFWERIWLVAMFLSTLALLGCAWHALSTPVADKVDLKAILEFGRRVIWLAIPSLFMRVSLTKYNSERGLATTYANRIAVMEQAKVWEGVIGDDNQAKEQLRMKLAQYICSDPQPLFFTNGNGGGQDININPVIGALDKLPVGKS